MKLHRDLNITQKSAWHLAHRLRKAFEVGNPLFSGPVEADETYIGGKEKNKHSKKKLRAGRGTVGKIAVAVVRDRATGQVKAQAVQDTKASTLQGFVEGHTDAKAVVYTDEATSYKGIHRPHEAINHSAGGMCGIWPTQIGWNRFGLLSSAVMMAYFTILVKSTLIAT